MEQVLGMPPLASDMGHTYLLGAWPPAAAIAPGAAAACVETCLQTLYDVWTCMHTCVYVYEPSIECDNIECTTMSIVVRGCTAAPSVQTPLMRCFPQAHHTCLRGCCVREGVAWIGCVEWVRGVGAWSGCVGWRWRQPGRRRRPGGGGVRAGGSKRGGVQQAAPSPEPQC